MNEGNLKELLETLERLKILEGQTSFFFNQANFITSSACSTSLQSMLRLIQFDCVHSLVVFMLKMNL